MSRPNRWTEPVPQRIEDRIAIERDATITVRSGKVEYGQGIRTGFAKIVAEELAVPIARVHVELGETDRVPWDMGTFGSLSIATDGATLRAAAVSARRLLLARAADRLHNSVSELAIRDGKVFARDGRAVSYEELTRGDPLTGEIPEKTPNRESPDRAVDAPLRLEALDIVTGRARYPADVRLPGMLHGHLLRPPVPDARLTRLDDQAARALPGIVAIVRDGDAVGVIAEHDEQALRAIAALRVAWEPGPVAAPPGVDISLRHDPGVDAAVARPTLEARYYTPHIAHASIGPRAAVADVRDRDADVYVSTHRPFAVRDEVAALLGFSPDRVHVHPQAMSGMYGRGNIADCVCDAARLSRAVRTPVLVQWTREEEFRFSPHRPFLDAEVRAVLDRTGGITAWQYDTTTNSHAYGSGAMSSGLIEMTSGRNAVPPYRLGKAGITLHLVPADIPTGPFRSLAGAPNVFAIESFVDELARASRQDPVDFRMRHIDDDRLRRTLCTVRDASGWPNRAHEPGRGFGVACAIYNRTYVAEVVEVTVDGDGRARLERAWCAVDPGHLVHPDGARNQIEGGIQQAASWTLLEELRIQDGRVVTAAWSDYPIATFHDAPSDISVFLTADEGARSTGIGEVGGVPTAAAIANAVLDACGARVRRLPLSPGAVAAARP